MNLKSLTIVNLDSYAQITELNSLDLLKINTEGFDTKVLNSAPQTIQRLQPVILWNINHKVPMTCSTFYKHKTD